MANNFVSTLLEKKPERWGLRGDPFFWDELKQKTQTIRLPETKADLEKLLLELFKELTGQEPEYGKSIYVNRYIGYGMSSGIVCADYWLEEGFPLIIQRFKVINNYFS